MADTLGIGSYLKKYRKMRGMSQEEFADSLYMERTAVSKWENDVNLPPLDKFADICSLLKVGPEELLKNMIIQEERDMDILEQYRNEEDVEVYETLKEAIGGFRAILMERGEYEQNIGEGDNDEAVEALRDWAQDNDFLFLYDTEADRVYGIRSYDGPLGGSIFLFNSQYIPVVYEHAISRLMRPVDEPMSSREEDGIIKSFIEETVGKWKESMKAYEKAVKKRPKKTVIHLVTNLGMNNYLGWAGGEYYAVNGIKAIKDGGYTVHKCDRKAEDGCPYRFHARPGEELDPKSVDIYIPDYYLASDVGLDISEHVMKHTMYFDRAGELDREYEIPREFIEKVPGFGKHLDKCPEKPSDMYDYICMVIGQLKEGLYVSTFVRGSLYDFQSRFDRLMRIYGMGVPDIILANEFRMLYGLAVKLEEGILAGRVYIDAEDRWNRKLGKDTEEEKLLAAIFGESRRKDAIPVERPEPLPREEVEKATELYKAIITDNGHEAYDDLKKLFDRCLSAVRLSLRCGTPALFDELCLAYTQYRDTPYKTAFTYVMPRLLCANILDGKVFEKELDSGEGTRLVRQLNHFKHAIDEIERG